MYSLTLTVHSWVRWALVVCALVAFLRSGYALQRGKAFSNVDLGLAKALAALLSLQLLLGLALYLLLSPIVRVGLSDLGAAMSSSMVRFFVVEHQVAALVAIGVGLAGVLRVWRAVEDSGRHKGVFWGAGGCLVMILIAIPWPFLPYGRALFRL